MLKVIVGPMSQGKMTKSDQNCSKTTFFAKLYNVFAKLSKLRKQTSRFAYIFQACRTVTCQVSRAVVQLCKLLPNLTAMFVTFVDLGQVLTFSTVTWGLFIRLTFNLDNFFFFFLSFKSWFLNFKNTFLINFISECNKSFQEKGKHCEKFPIDHHTVAIAIYAFISIR